MRSSWLRKGVSFGAGLLCATAVLAGDSVSEQRGAREAPNQFGTSCCQILQIPASSFVPTSSDVTWEYDFHGYLKPTNYGPFSSQFVATVTLPSGAALDWIDLYYCDTDPTWNIEATLRLLTGPTFNGAAPDYADFATVASSGSGGCSYAVLQLSHTINNDVYWNDGAQYTILVLSRNPITANLSFKGVDLWWHRQVHPAPAGGDVQRRANGPSLLPVRGSARGVRDYGGMSGEPATVLPRRSAHAQADGGVSVEGVRSLLAVLRRARFRGSRRTGRGGSFAPCG